MLTLGASRPRGTFYLEEGTKADMYKTDIFLAIILFFVVFNCILLLFVAFSKFFLIFL